MKKIYYLLVTILLSTPVFAQNFLGLRTSNWGGVTNVPFNPAIADSRFKVDINLIAFSTTFNNNYVGMSRKPIWDTDLFSDPDFQDKYLKERLNGKAKFAYNYTQIQGPLSFMFSFGKKNKNAIALTYHLNSLTNIDDFDEELARLAYYGLGNKAVPLFDTRYKDDNVTLKSMVWADYGITYSRVVMDNGPHFLKVGATLKLIQGLGAAYLYAEDAEYLFPSGDTLTVFQTEAGYGTSDNLLVDNIDDPLQFARDQFNFNQARPTVAGDVAVVYEWRPKKDKWKYDMDGETGLYRKDKNLYTIQAGFSATDLGRVSFKRANTSRDFKADIQNWYIKGVTFPDGIKSFNDTINSRFLVTGSNENFKLWLPMRFNFWLDYNIIDNFGISAMANLAPNWGSRKTVMHHITTFSITPHYDHAWFGAALPFSYDVLGNANLGLTLRLGPVIIGTQDFLGFWAKKNTYNADIHVAVKIPIPYGKPRDKDKDGVSNKKDKCKKDQGWWETRGCPDLDKDGTIDKSDSCVDVPGPKELNGCPDTDGDGILDKNDSCVTDKGPAELNGCPDTDGDKVIDKMDSCVTVPGLAEFNGCPDRDADGTPDKDDACPDVPGDKAHKGCPDTDGDGLYDNEDSCVQVKGPIENIGCPYPDTDGDGVLDKDDACPKVFGAADNRGCPKLEKKELETVKYAFDNLEFETGKDIIRKKSYPSLNGLADLLVKKANYGLKIEGHTDDVGSDENNLILSQKRADAVKKYLVGKGVGADKLQTMGYGESKPIADNKTNEGRQKNRRVEMNITFQ